MNILKSIIFASVLVFSPLAAEAESTKSPEGAGVYFVNLKDGAKVTSPVTVIMGLKNMGVAPAGTVKKHTGHHHIFVDRAPFGKKDAGISIPADKNHVHFGGGQTETTLKLGKGSHTLQLVLGDQNHIPHVPPVISKVIKITVTGGGDGLGKVRY